MQEIRGARNGRWADVMLTAAVRGHVIYPEGHPSQV